MKLALLKGLLPGLVVSLVFATWLFFRTEQFREGLVFSSLMGVSSFAAHSVVAVVSVVIICNTRATNTGAALRISIALCTAVATALFCLVVYAWARSLATDAGATRLPVSAEEVRFLSATDYRVATIALWCGVFGSLASSTFTSGQVRRDLAWFLGGVLSLVALAAVLVTVMTS